jgi:hypothetical protein
MGSHYEEGIVYCSEHCGVANQDVAKGLASHDLEEDRAFAEEGSAGAEEDWGGSAKDAKGNASEGGNLEGKSPGPAQMHEDRSHQGAESDSEGEGFVDVDDPRLLKHRRDLRERRSMERVERKRKAYERKRDSEGSGSDLEGGGTKKVKHDKAGQRRDSQRGQYGNLGRQFGADGSMAGTQSGVGSTGAEGTTLVRVKATGTVIGMTDTSARNEGVTGIGANPQAMSTSPRARVQARVSAVSVGKRRAGTETRADASQRNVSKSNPYVGISVLFLNIDVLPFTESGNFCVNMGRSRCICSEFKIARKREKFCDAFWFCLCISVDVPC